MDTVYIGVGKTNKLGIKNVNNIRLNYFINEFDSVYIVIGLMLKDIKAELIENNVSNVHDVRLEYARNIQERDVRYNPTFKILGINMGYATYYVRLDRKIWSEDIYDVLDEIEIILYEK